MSAEEMSDERNRPRSEDAAMSEVAQDDVEILGIEAVDESETESGSFDLIEAPEPDDQPPARPASEPASAPGGSERLLEELSAARDRHMRLLADFDNFRKRTEREKQETSKYALADSVRELLPVVDNLERALAAGGEQSDLRKGVEMIARQFLEVLRKLGVEPVSAVGMPFDPRYHEAVQRTDSEEVEGPTVVEEYQRGYCLNDRLIRPALVRVAVPHDSAGISGDPGDGEREAKGEGTE